MTGKVHVHEHVHEHEHASTCACKVACARMLRRVGINDRLRMIKLCVCFVLCALRANIARILERPWEADEVVVGIVDRIIRGPNSICQRIRHSDDFTALFEDAIKEMSDNPLEDAQGLRILSNALHSMDSLVEPMSRSCIVLEAVLGTAYKITVLHVDRPAAKDACYFLIFVSGEEGMERLLLLACFTDAGDMALVFLRTFDSEAHRQLPVMCMFFNA